MALSFDGLCLPGLLCLNPLPQYDGIRKRGPWDLARFPWGHEDEASWWDQARPLVRRGRHLRCLSSQALASGKGTMGP